MTLGPVLTVHIDGGARGNPGPAGWGVVVTNDSGEVQAELRGGLERATNNEAEYSALLAALDWCARQGARRVHIKSDSLLLVQQMLGNYRVKSQGLRPLHGRAKLLEARFGHVSFEFVPRERNVKADRLANLAMDEIEGLGA